MSFFRNGCTKKILKVRTKNSRSRIVMRCYLDYYTFHLNNNQSPKIFNSCKRNLQISNRKSSNARGEICDSLVDR